MPRHTAPPCNRLTTAMIGALLCLTGWSAHADNLPMAVTSESERTAALATMTDAPLRYAVGLTPSLTAVNGDSGGISIFSAGARSLGLRIRLHQWPDDQPLAWQSDTMSAPHRIEPRSGKTQWLPDVPGDIATLTWARDGLPTAASLTLELVYHGYRAVTGPQARAAGDAQACNIDVACPQADVWSEPVRATVMMTVDDGPFSRATCSASLLNNTAHDDRPLMITARHCGVTNANADSVIATFNYQRTVCGGQNDGVTRDTVSGSTFVGESSAADVTLLVLDRDIPSAYDGYLGGWSAEPVAPPEGAGIHHPDGDQKKISLFTAPATVADGVNISGSAPFGGFNVDAWRVRWSSGTTEVGSSGSGLWRQDRLLVGVLSGGSHSCSNLAGTDFYGRLPVAFDDSPAIRTALDPLSQGVVRALAGRNVGGGPFPDPSPTVTPTASPSPAPTSTPSPGPTPVNADDRGSGGGGTGIMSLALLLLAARVRRGLPTPQRPVRRSPIKGVQVPRRRLDVIQMQTRLVPFD